MYVHAWRPGVHKGSRNTLLQHNWEPRVQQTLSHQSKSLPDPL
jgi:hypothetical protein